jgi:hypothetical protein
VCARTLIVSLSQPKAASGLLLGVVALVLLAQPYAIASERDDVPAPEVIRIVDQIFPVVFPQTVRSEGITKGLHYRAAGYHFESEDEVNKYNIRSAHLVAETARAVHLKSAPLESPYWVTIKTESGAHDFVNALAAALPAGLPAMVVRRSQDRDVLRTALAQRDMFQTYALVVRAEAQLRTSRDKELVVRLKQGLAQILQSLFLTADEHASLVGSVPKSLPKPFTGELTYSLTDNYLPVRAVQPDDTWTEFPSGGVPFRHFEDYGGRSFVRVFIRSRELSGAQLVALWRGLHGRYGKDLHVTGLADPVPAGLQTMLVRSFGVFVVGGGYRDSGWPEEVIIRVFKYPASRLDLLTSDFRGTLFYQYKLSRAALLRDRSSLGLVRTYDDDEQFFGFFGDVPSPRNAYSTSRTTMRSNCIACHSELFYGLNTIFSFERNPGLESSHPSPEHHLLRKRADGEFELQTPDYASLMRVLRSSAGAAPLTKQAGS